MAIDVGAGERGGTAGPRSSTHAAGGLTSAAAHARLRELGPNRLPRPTGTPVLVRLLRELREPLALLLLVAGGVSWLVLGERVEGAAILVVVALNASISLVEQSRAATALAALEELDSGTVRVIRDGVWVVLSWAELVPGDVVRLDAGDAVPADSSLLAAVDLLVDESVLTGESLPVRRDADATPPDRLWRGTAVIRGTATALVGTTGHATRLGRLAASVGAAPITTPLQRDLAATTARLGVVSVVVAAIAFGLGFVRGGAVAADPADAFLAAVALAVAAVPEGLATVTTVALALGVRRMARRGAIVRRLTAVETLGAATVLVTDKTGTVTQNAQAVAGVLDVDGRPVALDRLATARAEPITSAMALCNDATLDPATGDPLEVALLQGVGRDRVETLRTGSPRLATVPFDADRRRMSVAVSSADGPRLLVKGAVEVVAPACRGELLDDGSIAEIDPTRLARQVHRATADGARVLAFAGRPTTTAEGVGGEVDLREQDLVLFGLVALRDPVRPHAAAAVRAARGAGITVVMATGDHAGTATAVAGAIGLATEPVREGSDLDRDGIADDPAAVAVYARVLPEHKLRLVERLRERGEVVAMTGDGVNDAPALRHADIGVALGKRGSDVAREASDLVVVDDDLATIVAAVEEGRGIYDDLRKVVEYLVVGNLAEVTVVIGLLLAVPAMGIPLLPLQLLWINLVTDGLPAIALGNDIRAADLLQRPPRSPSSRLLDGRRLRTLVPRSGLIALSAVAALALARGPGGLPWEVARTAMFLTLIGAHVLFAYVVRWPTPPTRGTPWLHVAVLGGLLLQVPAVLWGGARSLLDLTTLPGWTFGPIALLAIGPNVVLWWVARRDRVR